MEFYNSNDIKKTRKDHKCFLCRIIIPKSTACHYESGKFEGDFFSRYSHHECSKEWNKQNRYAEYGDEWSWFEGVEDGDQKEFHNKIKKLYIIDL